jgi:hypothetical protein
MSTQESLFLLVGPETGAQAWAEGSLDSVHRGFGEGSSTVTVEAFPICLAEEADAFDGAVSSE